MDESLIGLAHVCTAWRSPGWLQPDGGQLAPTGAPSGGYPRRQAVAAAAAARGGGGGGSGGTGVPVAWHWGGDEAWDSRWRLWLDDLHQQQLPRAATPVVAPGPGLDACCMQYNVCIHGLKHSDRVDLHVSQVKFVQTVLVGNGDLPLLAATLHKSPGHNTIDPWPHVIGWIAPPRDPSLEDPLAVRRVSRRHRRRPPTHAGTPTPSLAAGACTTTVTGCAKANYSRISARQ